MIRQPTESELAAFFIKMGVPDEAKYAQGHIVCNGDKYDQYEGRWKEAGLDTTIAAMLYLLSYASPYAKTVRDQPDGSFVKPVDWVIANYPDCLKKCESQSQRSVKIKGKP
jgi:hypothetical protein